MTMNVEKLVMPTLEKLRKTVDASGERYIDLLHGNLEELTSEFGVHVDDVGSTQLTPREVGN